jgi:hypothetical protein
MGKLLLYVISRSCFTLGQLYIEQNFCLSTTSIVLPLRFAPSLANSSQNSIFDKLLPDLHIPFKILKVLYTYFVVFFFNQI